MQYVHEDRVQMLDMFKNRYYTLKRSNTAWACNSVFNVKRTPFTSEGSSVVRSADSSPWIPVLVSFHNSIVVAWNKRCPHFYHGMNQIPLFQFQFSSLSLPSVRTHTVIHVISGKLVRFCLLHLHHVAEFHSLLWTSLYVGCNFILSFFSLGPSFKPFWNIGFSSLNWSCVQ